MTGNIIMKKSRLTNDCGKARAYTLVELLVAVAILVIMMGFLFEFIIGAQRIWRASESKATAFDTAQVAMDVIETDLHNMQYANDADAPGRTMPFYLWKKSANEIVMAFYADYKSSSYGAGDETKVGTYPVIYYYFKETATADNPNPSGNLYRIALDGDISFNFANSNGTPKPITVSNLWYLYGAEYTATNDFFSSLIKNAFGSTYTEENLKEFDVLAENIESFDVDALLGNKTDQDKFNPNEATLTEKRYAASRPKIVKLQMKIDSNHDENKGGMVTTNSFTKVIFL